MQHADLRGQFSTFAVVQADHGQPILCLTLSDANKELLLRADGLIRVLTDSLLLDPDHPLRTQQTRPGEVLFGATDFEAVKGPVQRDFAEAIEQLAVYRPGREALLQDPTVLDALREVADKGWTDEAKEYAAGALMALSDHQPDAERVVDQRHVMMSCKPGARLNLH